MAALISGLELEFGRGAAEGLAQRFLAAEECDLHWDARVEERWIGAYESAEDGRFRVRSGGDLRPIDGIGSLRCASSMATAWRTG
jgi:hypothetical protein